MRLFENQSPKNFLTAIQKIAKKDKKEPKFAPWVRFDAWIKKTMQSLSETFVKKHFGMPTSTAAQSMRQMNKALNQAVLMLRKGALLSVDSNQSWADEAITWLGCLLNCISAK
jgi:hypothetical protein